MKRPSGIVIVVSIMLVILIMLAVGFLFIKIDYECLTYGSCELTLNQLIACYQGCKFTTQPIYNITPVDDRSARIKLYDDCTTLCGERYYVEFDEEGDCR